jgi:diphosphoinositol-polyphosphate diphosphatase
VPQLTPAPGYGPSGERLVAGVVALSEDKYYVLMVQTNSGAGWVLPKGGWETDEDSQEAACREAWEEGGVVCTINYALGTFTERRSDSSVKAEYSMFEATVDRLESQWPEMHKRQRTWMSFEQAELALQNRAELLEALRRSSMNR